MVKNASDARFCNWWNHVSSWVLRFVADANVYCVDVLWFMDMFEPIFFSNEIVVSSCRTEDDLILLFVGVAVVVVCIEYVSGTCVPCLHINTDFGFGHILCARPWISNVCRCLWLSIAFNRLHQKKKRAKHRCRWHRTHKFQNMKKD